MAILPSEDMRKAMVEHHKDKLRKQMHHDLCVLMAGVTHEPRNAVEVYKELWELVMKEIP